MLLFSSDTGDEEAPSWAPVMAQCEGGWARAARFAVLFFSPSTSALMLLRRTRKDGGPQHHLSCPAAPSTPSNQHPELSHRNSCNWGNWKNECVHLSPMRAGNKILGNWRSCRRKGERNCPYRHTLMLLPLWLPSNCAEGWVCAGNLLACKGGGYIDYPVSNISVWSWANGRL